MEPRPALSIPSRSMRRAPKPAPRERHTRSSPSNLPAFLCRKGAPTATALRIGRPYQSLAPRRVRPRRAQARNRSVVGDDPTVFRDTEEGKHTRAGAAEPRNGIGVGRGGESGRGANPAGPGSIAQPAGFHRADTRDADPRFERQSCQWRPIPSAWEEQAAQGDEPRSQGSAWVTSSPWRARGLRAPCSGFGSG